MRKLGQQKEKKNTVMRDCQITPKIVTSPVRKHDKETEVGDRKTIQWCEVSTYSLQCSRSFAHRRKVTQIQSIL